MEMSEFISTLTNTSVTIVVIAFFMYRDIKWQQNLQETLDKLVVTTKSLDDILKRVMQK